MKLNHRGECELRCFFPQDKRLHYEAPWSPFHLVEITPVGSINTASHIWHSLVPCLNIEIVLRHIVVFAASLSSSPPVCSVSWSGCLETATALRDLSGERRWSISEGWHPPLPPQNTTTLNFFSPKAPAPQPLLHLLTWSSRNYFAKELRKKEHAK